MEKLKGKIIETVTYLFNSAKYKRTYSINCSLKLLLRSYEK